MSRQFRVYRVRGHYEGRITVPTPRKIQRLFVQQYGTCLPFIVGLPVLPLLTWKKLAKFTLADHELFVWEKRFGNHDESVKQWAAIENSVAELYRLFSQHGIAPHDLDMDISYPLIISGFKIKRGIVLNFYIRQKVQAFKDEFRTAAEHICDTLIAMHQ